MVSLARNKVIILAGIALLAIAAVFMFSQGVLKARANPPSLEYSNTTATTTRSFLTAGTGTTTEYYDTHSDVNSGADNAAFLFQFTGSSTAAVANIAFEYAQDNTINCATSPAACDWYGDDYGFPVASTTQSINPIVTTRIFAITFASTTLGGAAGSGDGRNSRIISVPTPTRFVRAVITLPAGSTNGTVWSRFIGKKQNP